MITVEYRSNNSGGSWWLKDADWHALEAAGWTVDWVSAANGGPCRTPDADGRWLGALAVSAEKEFDRPEDAVTEWEAVVGQDPHAEGCNCCGEPHSCSFTDNTGYHFLRREYTATSTRWD